jgi:hypothetical protein
MPPNGEENLMDFSSNTSLFTFSDLFPALWQWLLNGNDHLAFQLPDGSYRPSRKCELLAYPAFVPAVVEGRRTIGFYALGPQDVTRFGAVDFDADPEADGYFAALLFEQWAATRVPTILEASSPGRWHVWRLWPAFVPVAAARREIQVVVTQAGPRAPVEIFPKQDHATGKGYGNLIRFPGKHQARGTFSQLVAARNLDQVPPMKGWQEPTEKDRFEALYRNVTHRLVLTAPHTRYPAQVKLIGRLKAREVDEATARRVVGRWLAENETLIVDGQDRKRVWRQFDKS